MYEHLNNGFQFHKVRLKAVGMKKRKVLSMFQFHKVRLKVIELNKIYNEDCCFNSIRYD